MVSSDDTCLLIQSKQNPPAGHAALSRQHKHFWVVDHSLIRPYNLAFAFTLVVSGVLILHQNSSWSHTLAPRNPHTKHNHAALRLK